MGRNQMRDGPEFIRTHSPNDDQILRAFEGAMFLAVFDDSGREFGTDSRQRLQVLDGRRVDVDAVVRLRAGEGGNAQGEGAGKQQNGKLKNEDLRSFHCSP